MKKKRIRTKTIIKYGNRKSKTTVSKHLKKTTKYYKTIGGYVNAFYKQNETRIKAAFAKGDITSSMDEKEIKQSFKNQVLDEYKHRDDGSIVKAAKRIINSESYTTKEERWEQVINKSYSEMKESKLVTKDELGRVVETNRNVKDLIQQYRRDERGRFRSNKDILAKYGTYNKEEKRMEYHITDKVTGTKYTLVPKTTRRGSPKGRAFQQWNVTIE